jgi:hypothetical protein
MKEQLRPRSEQEAGPGGFGGPFDNDESNTAVTVTSGIYAEQLPVGNSSVGEIRARFRDRLDIDPQSVAILDGRDVDDQTTVRAGQVLMFVRRAGEKGLSTLTSSTSFARCEEFLDLNLALTLTPPPSAGWRQSHSTASIPLPSPSACSPGLQSSRRAGPGPCNQPLPRMAREWRPLRYSVWSRQASDFGTFP